MLFRNYLIKTTLNTPHDYMVKCPAPPMLDFGVIITYAMVRAVCQFNTMVSTVQKMFMHIPIISQNLEKFEIRTSPCVDVLLHLCIA